MIFWRFSCEKFSKLTISLKLFKVKFDQVLREHFDKIVLYFFVNQSPIVVDIPKLKGCNTLSIIAMVRESLSRPSWSSSEGLREVGR